MLFINAVVIAALIRLSMEFDGDETGTAFLAGAYGCFSFIMGLAWGYPFAGVTVAAAIVFGMAFAYFWFLYKVRDADLLWWVTVILGFPFLTYGPVVPAQFL
jgi:hypothetical protein